MKINFNLIKDKFQFENKFQFKTKFQFHEMLFPPTVVKWMYLFFPPAVLTKKKKLLVRSHHQTTPHPLLIFILHVLHLPVNL
jgi:hypothetical protein